MYIKKPVDERLGSAKLSPADPVVAGSWGSWRIQYTVGETGLEINAAVCFGIPSGFTYPQLSEPGQAGYTRVSCSNPGIPLECWVETSGIPYLTPRIYCRIPHRAGVDTLKPGETVTVIYGDRSEGGPGAQAQYFASLVEFTVAVDRHGMYGDYRTVPDSPRLEVVNDRAANLYITVPSLIIRGESGIGRIGARDRMDNFDATRGGQLHLTTSNPNALDVQDRTGLEEGKARFGLKSHSPGVARIEAVDSDGLRGKSNPARVVEAGAPYRLYWGDTHVMTGISCGEYRVDFTPRDILDYAYWVAQEEAGLDFCAVTDMDFDVRDDDYAETVAAAGRHYHPGRFVTFPGYEYCERVWDGDRTVLFMEDDPPLYRSSDPGSHTLPLLWEKFAGKKVLTTPHHPVSLRVGTRWRHHHPQFQRLVEIYSSWGDSEKPGVERMLRRAADYERQCVQAALAKGYRLGFVANSDSHTGQPGFSSWMFSYRGYRGGLTAVYARELTREAIFEAMYSRRVYGTTHARIILDFTINGHPMGSEIQAAPDDELDIGMTVIGTERLQEVTLVKNNLDYQVFSEDEKDEGGYRIRDRKDPGTHYDFYYVRVVQEDGERAWSSPIWVDRRL